MQVKQYRIDVPFVTNRKFFIVLIDVHLDAAFHLFYDLYAYYYFPFLAFYFRWH